MNKFHSILIVSYLETTKINTFQQIPIRADLQVVKLDNDLHSMPEDSSPFQ